MDVTKGENIINTNTVGAEGLTGLVVPEGKSRNPESW